MSKKNTNNDANDDLEGLFTHQIHYDISYVKAFDNTLAPFSVNVSTEFVIFSDDEEDDDGVPEENINTALYKIQHLMYNVFADSIIATHDNKLITTAMANTDIDAQFGNNIVISPLPPSDQVMALLLLAKFNAYGKSAGMFFPSITLKNNGGLLTTTFDGDPLALLPTMEEWIGENFYEQPWWNRDDPTAMDLPLLDKSKIKEPPYYEQVFSITPDHEEIVHTPSTETKIIKPTFNPKIIKGDTKKK